MGRYLCTSVDKRPHNIELIKSCLSFNFYFYKTFEYIVVCDEISVLVFKNLFSFLAYNFNVGIFTPFF